MNDLILIMEDLCEHCEYGIDSLKYKAGAFAPAFSLILPH